MLWKYFCVCDIICSLAKLAYFAKNTIRNQKKRTPVYITLRKSCATGKKVRMKDKTSKIPAICVLIVLILTSFCLFACNKSDQKAVDVNYQIANDFQIKTSNTDEYLVFEPILNPIYNDTGMTYTAVNYRYGIVFYTGLNIGASEYSYLGNALAKQGYLVVVSKDKSSFYNYATSEKAFEQYKNVRFFVGGHSLQGGAAAIRRASETPDIAGAVLLAPVGDRHKVLDENGMPEKDENGIEIQVADTLANSTLPTLLVNGDSDKVLTQAQIADTLSRMPAVCVKKTIEFGTHLGFTDIDDSNDVPFKLPGYQADFDATASSQRKSQRNLTVRYILEFLVPLSE